MTYTKEYFTWKGIRDEMIALKRTYGEKGVPKELWDQLERMCEDATRDMAKARAA